MSDFKDCGRVKTCEPCLYLDDRQAQRVCETVAGFIINTEDVITVEIGSINEYLESIFTEKNDRVVKLCAQDSISRMLTIRTV